MTPQSEEKVALAPLVLKNSKKLKTSQTLTRLLQRVLDLPINANLAKRKKTMVKSDQNGCKGQL